MKTQITVEIPDGYEITSLFRGKQYGQYDDGSAAIPYTIHIRPVKPFIINGVPSDWPEWLACDWVARDQGGRVWAYDCEPEKRTSDWHSVHGCYLLSGAIHIDIPGDWTQSKRENPRRKNKEVIKLIKQENSLSAINVKEKFLVN